LDHISLQHGYLFKISFLNECLYRLFYTFLVSVFL
jgi:hypothetical protein